MAEYNESQINSNETERINNEARRQTNETEREARETTRQSNESIRISEYNTFIADVHNAEDERKANEEARVEAENIRAEFYEGFNDRLDSVDSQLAHIKNEFKKPIQLKLNEVYSKEAVIKSQDDFDRLDEFIKTNDKVTIKGGLYFANKTFDLQNINNLNCHISNSYGEKVIITSARQPITPDNCDGFNDTHYYKNISLRIYAELMFLDENLEMIEMSNLGELSKLGCLQFRSGFEKYNNETKEVRALLPYALYHLKNKGKDYFNGSFIHVDSAFSEFIGGNIWTDDNYMYFTCPQYQYDNQFDSYINGHKKHSVNPYFNILLSESKTKIYYKNGTLYIPKNINKVYAVDTTLPLFNLNNTNTQNVSISGIEFNGISSLSTSNINNFNLYNNTFKNIINNLTSCEGNNVTIENNKLYNLNKQGFVLYGNNITINNNYFENCGILIKSSFPIRIQRGENFKIFNNEIVDFSYGGIRISDTKTDKVKGEVWGNHLYNTDKYNEYYIKNRLPDGGAIYVWWHTDGVVIKNNIIHDIYGLWYTNGIYLDDGCNNTTVQGNLIYNVSDNTVTMRYVSSNSESNKFNKLFGNVLVGKYICHGNPSYTSVSEGQTEIITNILLQSNNESFDCSRDNSSFYRDRTRPCSIKNNKIYFNKSNIYDSELNYLDDYIKQNIIFTSTDYKVMSSIEFIAENGKETRNTITHSNGNLITSVSEDSYYQINFGGNNFLRFGQPDSPDYIVPNAGNNVILGTDKARFKGIYLEDSPNISSKRELKENIELFDDSIAYEGLKNINAYHYNFKDDNVEKFGCIYEELPPECINKYSEGVDLYAYTTYCISALKKAIEKIELLEKEIKLLKK